MRYQRPRGTNDILPEDTPLWNRVEETFRTLCKRYGYHEIRTPVFEDTDLFTRSMGEHTDVVSKEMYTFIDRGGRSVTLKPEGTAPAVRAYVENNLAAHGGVSKLYYITPIFRYERPQAGRYRQAHQLGVEAIGSQHPALDAEVIALAMHFYQQLGITRLSLVLNSVGCPVCRPTYRERLREFARPFVGELCETCQTRYEVNPLRMLDCKREKCRILLHDAPDILDSLCEECRAHFDALRSYLDALGIPYVVDKHLVRGFDYYTKTAFEIVSDALGAQNALGGGGRYDGLVEEIGGPPTPGIGFALGIERTIIVLKELGLAESRREPIEAFVAVLGEEAIIPALNLLQALREAGISAETDYQRRSLKAQMKVADRLGCRVVLMLGEEELKQGVVTLRDMVTKEQRTAPIEACVAEVRQVLRTPVSP